MNGGTESEKRWPKVNREGESKREGRGRDRECGSGHCPCGLNTVGWGGALVLLIHPLPGTGRSWDREEKQQLQGPPQTHPGSPDPQSPGGACRVCGLHSWGPSVHAPCPQGSPEAGLSQGKRDRIVAQGFSVSSGSGGAGGKLDSQDGIGRTQWREVAGTGERGITALPLLLPPRLGSPLGLESGSCSVMFCSEEGSLAPGVMEVWPLPSSWPLPVQCRP